MKKITLLFALFAFTFWIAQIFPIDFSTSEDTFTGDGGAAFALAANPTDASDQLGKITANGGQYENVQLDLPTYLDLPTGRSFLVPLISKNFVPIGLFFSCMILVVFNCCC
jgi:hypothetical protein